MREEIDLGGSTLTLVCNAATPWIAKRLFKCDFMTFMTELDDKTADEKIERLEQLVYTMALQARMTTTDALNASGADLIEWVSTFDMGVMTTVILPKAISLWSENCLTSSKPKNQDAPQ